MAKYSSLITDPNTPVQFAAEIDHAIAGYRNNPSSDEAQHEFLQTVGNAVSLAKEMRDFSTSCRQNGDPLPDSFAAWQIAMQKLETREVVDALNTIFRESTRRTRPPRPETFENEGFDHSPYAAAPAYEEETEAEMTLDKLKQSLKLIEDDTFRAQEYASQKTSRPYEYESYSRPSYEEQRRRTSNAYSDAYSHAELISQKNWLATLLLCIFTGVVGGHCFYTGRIARGILYFFTGGLFGLGILYDLIKISIGQFKDRDGLPIRNM